MSEQLELLRPLVTDRVRDLVRDRLLHGLKFFDAHTLRPGFEKPEVKLALLLVRIANPKELLSKDESDLIESGMRQMQISAQKQHSSARKRHFKARRKKR